MTKIYDNLDFQNTSRIEDAARVHVHPIYDSICLEVQAFTDGQTSDIVSFKDGTGSDIWKVTSSSIIEVYSDTKNYADVINSNHSTRIISGHYIAPLISNAILSGQLNANSVQIHSLAAGSSLLDAVNLTQANAIASGLYSSILALADPFSGYILQAGTRGFTGAVTGVDGGTSSHFMTKGYIDFADSIVLSTVAALAASSYQPKNQILTNLSTFLPSVAGNIPFFTDTVGGLSNVTSTSDSRTLIGLDRSSMFDYITSGVLNSGARALYQVCDLAVISGTAESNLINCTIASGTLGAYDGLHVNLRGYALVDPGSNRNIAVRVYWGGTLMIGEYWWNIASGIIRPFLMDFVVQNLGSRTKQTIHGTFDYITQGGLSYGAFSGIAQLGGWQHPSDVFMTANSSGYPSKDTAVAQDLRVTVQPDLAHSRFYVKLDYAEIRYMRGTT